KLLDKIFLPPQDDSTVNKVVHSLRKNKSWTFPGKQAGERQFHEPFTGLLNAIKDEVQKLCKLEVYKNLKFEMYDANMNEGVDNDEPLKPDIIARQASISTSNKVASWKEIEFVGEVKAQWPDLVAQAATYARAILAFQRNRRWVPVIFFKHTSMEVKIGIFTASWLCMTKKSMSIADTSSAGFGSFVKNIARIVACNSRWHGGFDTSCNDQVIYIPRCGQYVFEDQIFSRDSVRGCRTRIYLVRKPDEETKIDTEQQGMDRRVES
ncbi:MAG TPA: hypothetical protein VGO47_14620, partial [Chlamydiales bacterium]|nr:hypothetical protein [Chlamydiales bacterium]